MDLNRARLESRVDYGSCGSHESGCVNGVKTEAEWPRMSEQDKAQRVFQALKAAQSAEPQAALAMLNGLIELTRGDGTDQSIEIDEARASAFLAICEVGKALHRGKPSPPPWTRAVAATERWLALAR